jgi:hypothetical protein
MSIPGFNRADELDPPAPPPHSVVRHTLTPPPDYLQTASAWRADLRPRRTARSPWSSLVAMALIAAALATSVWTYTAIPTADARIHREAAR